jgi:hypothetical protein
LPGSGSLDLGLNVVLAFACVENVKLSINDIVGAMVGGSSSPFVVVVGATTAAAAAATSVLTFFLVHLFTSINNRLNHTTSCQ